MVRQGTHARRNCDLAPRYLKGKLVCKDCDTELIRPVINGKSRRTFLRCWPCRNSRYLAMTAVQSAVSCAVIKAIREGHLKRPTEFTCADCAEPATAYDHRDYTQPLLVEPVCRRCNVMRGPADVWPVPIPGLWPKQYRLAAA